MKIPARFIVAARQIRLHADRRYFLLLDEI